MEELGEREDRTVDTFGSDNLWVDASRNLDKRTNKIKCRV